MVGLPNVGKSTIFNALSAAGARVESYPFTTIESQIGVVEVPDERLERLAALYPDKRKVSTTLEFVDIAGLVKGASQGEGLGNQFLAEIRNVDAIAQVVRCFEDEGIAHVDGSLDPKRDIEVVETELLLKDLETLERRLRTARRETRTGDKAAVEIQRFFERVHESVAEGQPVRELELSDHERDRLRDLSLLTAKPILYVANVGETGENRYSEIVERIAAERGAECVVVLGSIEAEIAETAETLEERSLFLEEWGIKESSLNQLIRAGYRLLSLITFFTTDGPEVRAWTVLIGTTARWAGGKIHSDFEDRFIQAEVVQVQDLLEYGSTQKARETGELKQVGEEYVVQDGDVIHFIVG